MVFAKTDKTTAYGIVMQTAICNDETARLSNIQNIGDLGEDKRCTGYVQFVIQTFMNEFSKDYFFVILNP